MRDYKTEFFNLADTSNKTGLETLKNKLNMSINNLKHLNNNCFIRWEIQDMEQYINYINELI